MELGTPGGMGKRRIWAGWLLSGLVIAFCLLDAVMKLMALPIVLESGAPLGFPGRDMAYVLGTAVLGAILLTAYLGGAVATHVRVGSPLFTHTLFGVYLGIFVWAGLYLRDRRVASLLPFRQAD